MLQLIAVATFITVIMFLFPILKVLAVKKNSINRIKKYINMEELREEKKKSSNKELKIGFGIISKKIGNARFLDGYKKNIQMKLTRAHILLKPEEYITVCLFFFTAAALVTFLITSKEAFNRAILLSVGAGMIGWLLPTFFLKSKIKRRLKQLNDQLCDAITLISNSLKAGYSFFQAVDTVAKEMNGPISDEFLLMQKEVNLGTTTEKALENLVARVDSDDLELVVTAVLIQRQVGGNLSEVLDNISTTIRERIKIKGEIRTVTAQGRMSGIIISLLPPALGLILFVVNPQHVGMLFNNPIGLGILVFSIFMELIGIYFITQIVKIDV
ncbi:MAG: type II secretion system F family protein [Clostridia bacterium]|nr:type II secretion system F family protein [Clostridia bacterium]